MQHISPVQWAPVTRCGAPVRRPRTLLTVGWLWECSQRVRPCSELGLSWPSGRRSWRHTRRWACGWVWRHTGHSWSPPWWQVWHGGSCSRCASWQEQSCKWPEGGSQWVQSLLKEGNLQWKEWKSDIGLRHGNMCHGRSVRVGFRILLQDIVTWIRCSPWTACMDWTVAPHEQHTGRRKSGWERL